MDHWGRNSEHTQNISRNSTHADREEPQAELMISRNLRYPLNVLKPPIPSQPSVTTNAKVIAEREEKVKEYIDKKRSVKPNDMNLETGAEQIVHSKITNWN